MRGFNENSFSIPIFPLLLLQFSITSSLASDTITRNQRMQDEESLVSENEIFELGFFSLSNSTLRYLGIWYKDIKPRTIVWVANREKPVLRNTGSLKIADDGNLVLVTGENVTVWSTETRPETNNTVASLSDKGNLVLADSDTRKLYYWESFDHPTDTYLPWMRARVNPSMGDQNRPFVPWSSENDPSPGRYSMGIDANGPPQIVIWEGQKRKWRSGQWNSMIFTGVPDMHRSTNYLFGFKLSPPDPDGSAYFTYVPIQSSDLLRFWITSDGIEEQFRWDKEIKEWTLIQRKPGTDCEKYNYCGNNSLCNDNNLAIKCSCIDGFEPVFLDQWNSGNFSGGCQRRVPLKCQRNNDSRFGDRDDGFKGLKYMKLPDFGSVVSLDGSKTCKDVCSKNCSCNAYAQVDGIGCMIWNDDLLDIQQFTNGGSLMNIRLAGSELGDGKISNLVIIIVCVIGSFLLLLSTLLLWRFRESLKAFLRKKKDLSSSERSKSIEYSTEVSGSMHKIIEGNEANAPDLPIFSFNFIASATSNFAEENKLGQGGFGTVYKGDLPGGQEIAVKRLSGKSKQGLEEFKNEIILIAKLQHRNLVRLLGCCIQGDEKMLVYEYMPNKSLDSFLFDKTKQAMLDWKKRFMIIEGIARGLLYLHRDSRLKIIHRDLKASNILLDGEMTPKISDFGMARIFSYRQDEANTIRVVGTYGYMSPEYAMGGLFSEKSDVYSFGVLLLEIVSGRKNVSFRHSEHGSLIGYAWSMWSQGRGMEVIDPTVQDSCNQNEELRCIHVGMLCVQDSATRRPNMASVVLMLESETSTHLPLPRRPTFHSFRGSKSDDIVELNLDGQDFVSINEITVTTVVGR